MRRGLAAPILPAPMPSGVNFMPFDEASGRACRDLMNRVYADGFGDVVPFERWWPWLTADAEYDPGLMFVAVSGGAVGGFCHCWSGAFIKDVVVDQRIRGRGLGAALITAALVACKTRGARFVDLKTDCDNVKAQSLYGRLGFEIIERIDN